GTDEAVRHAVVVAIGSRDRALVVDAARVGALSRREGRDGPVGGTHKAVLTGAVEVGARDHAFVVDARHVGKARARRIEAFDLSVAGANKAVRSRVALVIVAGDHA